MNIKKITKKLGVITATVAIAFSFSLLNGEKVNADTGWFTGSWSGYYNSLNIAPSLTGDTLFGYNNGCAYGNFSHVGMCFEGSYYANGKWDGRCIESIPAGSSNSVYNNNYQSRFKKYDAASLDGVDYNIATWGYNGYNVVQKANSYEGPYDWTASFNDNSKWYCSKMVSRAFYDLYGYTLGWTFINSGITPEDIWYDNLVKQRTYSTSAGYDGNGVWSSSSSASLTSENVSTFTYNGVIVESIDSLDENAKNNAKKRIDAEIAAGKKPEKITIENTKPGLNNYLKKYISSGKATKEQVKEKWNVTDADLN